MHARTTAHLRVHGSRSEQPTHAHVALRHHVLLVCTLKQRLSGALAACALAVCATRAAAQVQAVRTLALLVRSRSAHATLTERSSGARYLRSWTRCRRSRVWRPCSAQSRQTCCRRGSAGGGGCAITSPTWLESSSRSRSSRTRPPSSWGHSMVVRPQAHQPRRDGHVQPLDDVAWGATIALLRNAIALAYVTQAGHACAGGVLRRLRHGLGHAGRAVPA